MKGLRACILLGAGMLAACAGGQPEHRADWVIQARVVSVSADLQQEHVPTPGSFRLWFPFLIGELYGAPETGDFFQVQTDADGGFELDLNRGHASMLKSLQPTALSLPWLRIEPAGARIARLLPFVMQADGIEQIGDATWLDADSRRRLMLIYVDRAARIAGSLRKDGRAFRYDIRAPEAGYFWVAESGDAATLHWQVTQPRAVLLAVTPVTR